MSTDHLIMVIKNQKTVVAQYAPWDGYPAAAGVELLSFARCLATKDKAQSFKDALDKCIFVTAHTVDKLCAERITSNDTTMHPQFNRDISVGIFELILDNDDDNYPLVDSSDFVNDSLMCKWVYVLDMDTNTLEVYGGENTLGVSKENRFQGAGQQNHDGSKTYYPVQLKNYWQFDDLPTEKEFINGLGLTNETVEDVEDVEDVETVETVEDVEDVETVEDEFTRKEICRVIDQFRNSGFDEMIIDRICSYIEANMDEFMGMYKDVNTD